MKNTMRWLVAAAFFALPILSHADDASVDRKAVSSVVVVVSTAQDGRVGYGTGVVVIATEVEGVGRSAAVVTAGHVIKDAVSIQVVFPAFDSKGVVFCIPEYYAGRGKACRVMGTDRIRDLALLMVTDADDVRAISMATAARPGDQVFTVGCSSSVLWNRKSGSVKAIHPQGVYRTQDGVEIKACFIDTTVSTRQGDSGGPILNRRGELVGINVCGDVVHDNVHLGIYIADVKAFIAETLTADIRELGKKIKAARKAG